MKILIVEDDLSLFGPGDLGEMNWMQIKYKLTQKIEKIFKKLNETSKRLNTKAKNGIKIQNSQVGVESILAKLFLIRAKSKTIDFQAFFENMERLCY